MTARRRFRLTLEALPDLEGKPPAEVRLRSALKALLRAFRLRCVEAVEVTEGVRPPPWIEEEVPHDG